MSSAASAKDSDDRRPSGQVPAADDDPGTSPVDTEVRPPDEIVPETQPEEEDDFPAERNEFSKLMTNDRTRQHEGLDPALNEGRASEVASDGPPPLQTEGAPPETTETSGRREQVAEMSSHQQAETSKKAEMEEESKQPATAEQMAAALQHSLQTATYRKPRPQAWMDLVQQLFETVFPKSPSKKKYLSAAAQRLPRLTKPEMERLVDVFEDIVVSQHQDWTSWSRLVVASCHTVYISRQSLEYVLSKELGKVSMQTAELQAPVLTQWAQKVAGQQEGGG
ncbi:hypothetical protein PHYSODRAFT_259009 [Phytophthora sojae]|uniref:Uncharacterized protein n=1 Tax=Phytophthora sojae (strain P6497) TaxID=1094619 RepID=G4ZE20_PHYSP|nr:hypothetical protein PHYSODRAFT_259009 [Phytophthora sojae]EGZ16941.1 hypothetical protein PHYSODRAFT_259009 [Phytophthora sojae]|eukprot:XP_009525999.1 hypothetical protein PHYSODRAFT_259009 [Phytophthora sojae]